MTRLVLVALLAMPGRAHAESGERWDGTTVAGQSVAASAVVAGGSVLFMKTFATCGWNPGDRDSRWCLHPVAGIGVPALTVAAMIASVQLIGDARDGTGSLLGTTLGLGTGFVVGWATAYAAKRWVGERGALIVPVLAGMVAGAVVGYHLTSDDPAAALRVPLVSGAF